MVMARTWIEAMLTLTLDTVGGEEGNVAGFQGVVMGTVR